jgi:hypothetical protein
LTLSKQVSRKERFFILSKFIHRNRQETREEEKIERNQIFSFKLVEPLTAIIFRPLG